MISFFQETPFHILPLHQTGGRSFPGSGHQTGQEEEIRRLKRELVITRQERDILKSSQHLLTGVQMKYQFLAEHQQEYPVKTMCRVLGVAVTSRRPN